MAYRVTAPLVVAKDREGRNHHCYAGAIIHWLGPEQRDRWLRLGLVEEIDDTPPLRPPPTAPRPGRRASQARQDRPGREVGGLRGVARP